MQKYAFARQHTIALQHVVPYLHPYRNTATSRRAFTIRVAAGTCTKPHTKFRAGVVAYCHALYEGSLLMTEAEAKAKTAKPMSATTNATFAIPKFEIPQFEMPKVEIPEAFREFAEKGASQAQENYKKMKAAAEEATDALEATYAIATKGAADYGLKLIEAARTNTNAAFSFYGELMAVKSMAEVVELSTAHARKQFDALSVQTKELTVIAQKTAVDASEPVKAGVSKAFSRVT